MAKVNRKSTRTAQEKLGKKESDEKTVRRNIIAKEPKVYPETVTQEATLDVLNHGLSRATQKIQDLIIGIKPPTGNEIDISDCYNVSTRILRGYASLDESHRKDIFDLIKGLVIYSKDKKRKRPLNIIIQANPGSGKSHFIKCLSKRLSLYDIQAVSFNMATMEYVGNLIAPLEIVRNIKAKDNLPLLFLDEFDSKITNIPILLPLLWDGEFQSEHHLLQIGRCIIILAGSQKNIEKIMEIAKSMNQQIPEQEGKLPDLLSRINGGELIIPQLDDDSKGQSRKADKICIAISLLERRFSNVVKVPWSLLNFISEIRFRYGVRSIEHLIDLINTDNQDSSELTMSDIERLPVNSINQLRNSSLAYHIISHDHAIALFHLWQERRQYAVPVKIRRIGTVDSLDLFLQKIRRG